MALTRIQTIDTGAGHRVQINTDRDGGLVVVSSEGNVFLSRLLEDGSEEVFAPTVGYAQFRSGFVETLSDGRYVVYATDFSGLGWGMRFQVFNRDGSAATAIINPAFEGGADALLQGYTVTATADGGLAVAWNDISRSGEQLSLSYPEGSGTTTTTRGAGYDVRLRYFDATGTPLGASSVMDDDVESVDGAVTSRRAGDQYINDTETLAGGQVASVYVDTRYVGQPGGGARAEFQLSLQLSTPGAIGEPVKIDLAPFSPTGPDFINGAAGANIVALPDGTLAVVWVQSSYNSGGTFTGTDTIIRYFDAAGNALTDGTVLVHRSTDLGNINRYTWAEALPDGRIVIAWNDGLDGRNGNGMVDAYLGIVGALGSSIEITRANAAAATNTQNYAIQDLAVRTDGTVDLVYNDARLLPNGFNLNSTIVDRFSLGLGFNGIVLAGTGADDDLSTGATARNDQIAGLAGDDIIRGGDGRDEIFGNTGNDRLFGDAGNDELFGNEGDDVLEGGTGADELRGGTGLDSASYAGAAGPVNVNLATGLKSGTDAAGDSYISIEGLIGTAFADRLTGDDGANRLEGLGGNDILTGGLGDDLYFLETAGDRIVEATNGGTDTVVVGFNYALAAPLENLTLIGLATNGTGNDANNVITGNDRANLLKGLDGTDMLFGGAGNDTLYGGTGNDQLYGGDGTDRLYQDGGNDFLSGGAGNDSYYILAGSGGSANVSEAIGGGVDTVRSALSFYAASGSEIETIILTGTAQVSYGNEFANRITGNGTGNFLVGFGGDDVLRGESGNDTLVGGDGADLIIGGIGKDTLQGGAGADIFQLFAGDTRPGRTNADIVSDFRQAEGDRINLFQIDAIEGTSVNDRFTFIGTAAFGGVAGELRFVQDGGNTYVSGDTNGDSVVDLTITVTGLVTFISTDFVL